MRHWFFLFLLSIGSGGFFALLVALSRTPGVSSLFPPQLFYHWLIGHVDLALIIGFLSFLVFLWHRVFEREHRAYELVPAYLGSFLILISALFGLGTPVHNNYVPTIDTPIFFLGVFFFGVGFFLTSFRFLPSALRHLLSGDVLHTSLSISVLLSLLFPTALLISFLKTQRSEEVYLYFERLYWLPGHIHQFINASLLLTSWSLLAKAVGVEPPRWVRGLLLLLLPFPLIYLLLQLTASDSIAPEVKRITTLGYALGIGLPTIVYALSLLFRVKRNFYGAVTLLSILIYLMGAGMGYLIAGSDLRIPAHYHGVIASVLIALMGLTYYYLQELGYARRLPVVVRLQPYLYGVGMILFVSGLFWAGVYGAPRKTFGTGYIESFKVYLFMLVMGLGSVLSVLGGIIFVGFVLYSIIKRNGFRVQEEAR